MRVSSGCRGPVTCGLSGASPGDRSPLCIPVSGQAPQLRAMRASRDWRCRPQPAGSGRQPDRLGQALPPPDLLGRLLRGPSLCSRGGHSATGSQGCQSRQQRSRLVSALAGAGLGATPVSAASLPRIWLRSPQLLTAASRRGRSLGTARVFPRRFSHGALKTPHKIRKCGCSELAPRFPSPPFFWIG